MYIEQPDLTLLGGGFPPTLNTFTRASELKPSETPSCYGLDLTVQGLKRGSIPTGSTKTLKSTTISGTVYYWAYQRLWSMSTNTVLFGAPLYEDVYLPQRNGKITFTEDTNNVTALVTGSPDSMFVLKQTGGHWLSNLSDSRALFQRTDLIPYLACSSSANAIEMDGLLYVSNSYGLIASDGKEHIEISQPIRNNISWVQNVALTADWQKKWIIAGNIVYDTVTKKLFRYNSTNFLYTSPEYHRRGYEPFTVERLIFIFERTNTSDADLTYSVRCDEEDWSTDFDVKFTGGEEQYSVKNDDLATPRSTKIFQLRITSMSSNLIIKEIRVNDSKKRYDDYTA